MASDLQGQFAVAANANFQQRVSSALAAVAVQVYTEVPPPANHAARAAYAAAVVNDPPLGMISLNQFGTATPDKRVYAVTRLLAAQGLDNTSTDAAIQAQILADWNALANA